MRRVLPALLLLASCSDPVPDTWAGYLYPVGKPIIMVGPFDTADECRAGIREGRMGDAQMVCGRKCPQLHDGLVSGCAETFVVE